METELILKNVARHITLNENEKSFFLSQLEPLTLKRKKNVSGGWYRLQAFRLCTRRGPEKFHRRPRWQGTHPQFCHEGLVDIRYVQSSVAEAGDPEHRIDC